MLDALRAEGFAGATVIDATAGLGALAASFTRRVSSELSSDLPGVIEVVDDDAHIGATASVSSTR